jgi:hypothetical protein
MAPHLPVESGRCQCGESYAGRPTGRQIDEDTAYAHLQMGAAYLQKND